MRLYAGITDGNWFEFLAGRPEIDEVNFWQPSGNRYFRALQKGELFLFKLHAPRNCVAGYGVFAHSSILPISLAWKYFQEKNGVSSLEEMRQRVEKYRRIPPRPFEDYQIGCVMIQRPVFLPESRWFTLPEWRRGIQQGRNYDLESGEGKAILHKLQVPDINKLSDVQPVRYGEPVQVRPRVGQATFRSIILDVYGRRCAVTGEKILPVLDSAHIKPYAHGGTHEIPNGILLRQDVHTLFDAGYVTISPDYHFEVSRRIKTDFDNGRNYYALHGREILLPLQEPLRPDKNILRWHNEGVFKR